MNRDPIGEAGGKNIYLFSGNDGVNNIDLLGLEWDVAREGDARASAIPENGDTVQDLADLIGLNAEEYRKWLKPLDGSPMPASVNARLTGCHKYTVPNTAHIDVSSYASGFLFYRLIFYRNSLANKWGNEGYKVVPNYPATRAEVVSHMSSEDLYVYAFIGHGGAGCILANVDVPGAPEENGFICPERLTAFGIFEMQLIACESNEGASKWKPNVSRAGTLRTVKGKCTIFNFDFVDEHGN